MYNAQVNSSMLRVTFYIFVVSLLLCGTLLWNDMSLLIPFGFVFLALLAAGMLTGALVLWQLSAGSSLILVSAAVVAVDLGMQAHASLFLVIKGALYCLALVIGIRDLQRAKDFGFTNGILFLAYAIFAWMTVFLAKFPLGLLHTGLALVSLAFVSIAIERATPNQATLIIGWIAKLVGAGCVISIVLYFALPSLVIAQNVAGEGRSGGIFGSPNSFGAVSAIGVLASIGAYLAARKKSETGIWFILLSLLCGGGLLFSGSRTALLALMISLSLCALIFKPKIVFSFALVALGMVFLLDILNHLDTLLTETQRLVSRNRYGDDVKTLTGRLPIWNFAFNAWLAEPFLGFGLGESRRVMTEGWRFRWGGTTETAHNLILESLLNVGIVGTLVLIGIVLRAIVTGWRIRVEGVAQYPALYFVACAFISFGVLQGITEKSFGGTASVSTGALAVAIGCFTLIRRRGAIERH